MSRSAPPPSSITLHRLPPQLRMLVRVMGERAAFRLVERRGGTPFTVPKHLAGLAKRDLEQLLDLVGSAEAAAALVAELSAQTLQLPKYDSVLRQLRHRRVAELRQMGHTQAEVALQTGYTVRQVINILNSAGLAGLVEPESPAAALQGDLFGDAGDDDAAGSV